MDSSTSQGVHSGEQPPHSGEKVAVEEEDRCVSQISRDSSEGDGAMYAPDSQPQRHCNSQTDTADGTVVKGAARKHLRRLQVCRDVAGQGVVEILRVPCVVAGVFATGGA